MTFPEQILGVPPELVEQGWRREPPRAVQLAWDDHRITNPDRLQRWVQAFIQGDGFMLDVWRPEVIGKYPAATAVYSHAGWGEGLAPTPETCKVWKWWWCQWDQAIPVCVKEDHPGGTLVCQWVYGMLPLDRITDGKWLGPVLPPVRQS